MNRIVVDASALAAVVFAEPEGEAMSRRLDGAMVFAPTLLQFEMASIARKKVRQQPTDATKILTALNIVLEAGSGVEWCEVDPSDAVLVAEETGLTTYDASYVWLAGSLGADLVTLDKRIAKHPSK